MYEDCRSSELRPSEVEVGGRMVASSRAEMARENGDLFRDRIVCSKFQVGINHEQSSE